MVMLLRVWMEELDVGPGWKIAWFESKSIICPRSERRL